MAGNNYGLPLLDNGKIAVVHSVWLENCGLSAPRSMWIEVPTYRTW